MDRPQHATPATRPAIPKRYEIHNVIGEAILWLDRPQPAGAIISHHGIVFQGDNQKGRFKMSLCPVSSRGMPFFIFETEWPDDPNERPLRAPRLLRTPITEEEVEYLRGLIDPYGISDAWNGLLCPSYSIQLDRLPGAGVQGLVDRCRKGCTTHPQGPFCKCPWFSDGYKKAILPEGWA